MDDIRGSKTVDFTYSNYTAIISDLHLCEAEPVNEQYPLWKKYKTAEFFFDEELCQFLDKIQNMSGGDSVELVLNGDVFDFDSVSSIPEHPPYRVTKIEKLSGLHPQENKSVYKIKKILKDHQGWVNKLSEFICNGNKVIIVIGNHDLELHWPQVQQEIVKALKLPEEFRGYVRFTEWFYISNKDTHIEHGNQYDPYCLAQDPINPFIKRFNRVEVRVPFGNLATRYMINNMGFFNPHVESNFIMSAKEYILFFFKYVVRAQPLLMWTWIKTATMTLFHSFTNRLLPSYKDPLRIEDKIQSIALKANATPRMVRELKELTVSPASSNPLLIARELWLDRAFIAMIGLYVIFHLILYIKTVTGISIFWMFIPLLMFLPFFIFYSKSIYSDVHEYKEPKDRIMWMISMITRCKRVVFGHTHEVRHELIGPVEHLNSGTWSPAFKDVECTIAADAKTFVWIRPANNPDQGRVAELLRFQKETDSVQTEQKQSAKVLAKA
ncbi:MAG: metallophosphoesterase [Bdellovibrionales bacterium]|nr:metallophosphoesterase [Bdellovibrionales bacterium]